MPVYALECAGPDAHQNDVYLHSWKTPNPPCVLCGAETDRVWKITRHLASSSFPYTTKHLTGSPIEVTDAAHEKRLLKQHGLRKRDDNHYGHEEDEVVDFKWEYDRSGKYPRLKSMTPIYRTSGGRGMPGSWY